MTFREAIGVRVDTDIVTGEKLTHSEIYRRAIHKLGGFEAVLKYIPFTLKELQSAYQQDEYFNSIDLKCWDAAAGFITSKFPIQPPTCIPSGSGLYSVLRKYGITSASCSECVCVLKEAARMLINRQETPHDRDSRQIQHRQSIYG